MKARRSPSGETERASKAAKRPRQISLPVSSSRRTFVLRSSVRLAANLSANPFEAVTTVTVQIVTLLVGDQEFDSAKTLAAFALGLTLFLVTLTLNVIALSVVRRYREQYD